MNQSYPTRRRGRELLRPVLALLCPVLLALFPLLSLFAQNDSELELVALGVPLVLTVAVAAAVFAILALCTRNAAKAGALASLLVVGFFYYGAFAGHIASLGISGRVYLALWLALVAVGLAAGLRTTRNLGNLTLALAAGAAVMTATAGCERRPIPGTPCIHFRY